MIPISDDNTGIKTVPVITYALILLNVFIFFSELIMGETFIVNWSFIPSRFTANPIANIPTVFTSMFMHAGWAHLIGNMLYLWIFGDNVEDRFGKVKYLILYLICGIVATFSQMAFDSTSSVPHLGASGAIGGVLGAYILLFPKGTVNVLLGQTMTRMSALIVIGFWFLLQFASTIGVFASSGETDGVAYMAHIGGFLSGLIIAFLLKSTNTPT